LQFLQLRIRGICNAFVTKEVDQPVFLYDDDDNDAQFKEKMNKQKLLLGNGKEVDENISNTFFPSTNYLLKVILIISKQ